MSMEIQSAKAEMRVEIGRRLAGLSMEARAAASGAIRAALVRQDVWQRAGSVLFFAPMPGEPDVWPLVERAIADGKTVALPRFNGNSGGYVACRVQHLATDIHTGRFGIREPLPGCLELALNRLDLALVPGVAFDGHGRRLGRGRGYYDRLLAGAGGIKCGIAFDEQIVAEVPAGPHDVHLNCILTPTRWIET